MLRDGNEPGLKWDGGGAANSRSTSHCFTQELSDVERNILKLDHGTRNIICFKRPSQFFEYFSGTKIHDNVYIVMEINTILFGRESL